MTVNPLLTARTAIVFVLEHQPFDYNAATKFGELKFMDTSKLAPAVATPTQIQAPESWNENVLNQFRRELCDYIPGTDYILPTGAPAKMVVAGMLLKEKGNEHRILAWDARTQHYLEYKINL